MSTQAFRSRPYNDPFPHVHGENRALVNRASNLLWTKEETSPNDVIEVPRELLEGLKRAIVGGCLDLQAMKNLKADLNEDLLRSHAENALLADKIKFLEQAPWTRWLTKTIWGGP